MKIKNNMHNNAAGCSIANHGLEVFHSYANDKLKDIDFGENCFDINFQRDINAKDLTDLIYNLCSVDGIWGQGNPEPLISVTNLILTKDDIQIMGSNKDTLKINYNGISFLKFHAKELINDINEYKGQIKLEIVGRPNLNDYLGRISPQVFIESYEIKESNNTIEF